MKNKKTIANIALLLLVVGGIFLAVYSIKDSSFSFIANENDFLLTLDSSSKISNENEEYIDEKEGHIRTKYNNQITVYSSNLLNNNSGWQSLKPYGYFYNPILEDDLNKISGLKAIEFKGDSGDQLSLIH